MTDWRDKSAAEILADLTELLARLDGQSVAKGCQQPSVRNTTPRRRMTSASPDVILAIMRP